MILANLFDFKQWKCLRNRSSSISPSTPLSPSVLLLPPLRVVKRPSFSPFPASNLDMYLLYFLLLLCIPSLHVFFSWPDQRFHKKSCLGEREKNPEEIGEREEEEGGEERELVSWDPCIHHFDNQPQWQPMKKKILPEWPDGNVGKMPVLATCSNRMKMKEKTTSRWCDVSKSSLEELPLSVQAAMSIPWLWFPLFCFPYQQDWCMRSLWAFQISNWVMIHVDQCCWFKAQLSKT